MALSIILYPNSMYQHHRNFAARFKEGLGRHGIDAAIRNNRDYVPSDLAVFWGHRLNSAIQGQKKCGGDYLVMERGYCGDRIIWTSLGFNGLNGRAEFHNAGSPPDRWLVHAHLMQPWRAPGDYVLVMGQVAGDASIHGVDIRGWYADAITAAEKVFDLPIYFRPHPLARQQPPELGVKLLTGELSDALGRAQCAVTFNSNSGVDAILAGVPVIAVDKGAMVWPLARHHITAELVRPDRSQWAFDLAYCQWTPDEIKRGIAWDHLKQRYDQ